MVVIRVTVVGKRVVTYNFGNRLGVKEEQNGTKNRTLRNTEFQRSWSRGHAFTDTT